jgi:hypothetical protein
MIGQLIVGVALARTQHAGHARVASLRAIRLHLYTMCEALGDIPSGGERYCASRACTDAGACSAGRTGVEPDGIARSINVPVNQESTAKRDPGSERWMDNDSDDTRPGKPGYCCQLHEIQRRSVAEGVGSDAADALTLNRHNDFALNNFSGEIVERILPFEPSSIVQPATNFTLMSLLSPINNSDAVSDNAICAIDDTGRASSEGKKI